LFPISRNAVKFQEVLTKRLAKFTLQIEPNKTRLVEFGRFSYKRAIEKGKKMETVYFLGFTHYCTRNRKGNFMVGRKTEKTRLNRSMKWMVLKFIAQMKNSLSFEKAKIEDKTILLSIGYSTCHWWQAGC